MTSRSRRTLSSGLSGGLAGAGSGAATGAAIGLAGGPIGAGLGSAIGAGIGLVGGFLTPDDPVGMSPEELALEQQKLAQQNNQFNMDFKQKQLNDSRQFGIAGLSQLMAQRQEAQGRMRRGNFRNDLLSAAQGVS